MGVPYRPSAGCFYPNHKVHTKGYIFRKDEIYRIIIDGLIDKFGIRKTYIWELYACQGKSAKEIMNMGFKDIENFVYFNRQIKRYIHRHIIPDNKKLQELIDCRKGA